MPSTAWSGSISFGLVSIPVKLYSAVSRKTVRFHQVDTRTGARVKQKRVSADDGSEVVWDDIAKGYEQSNGEYVLLTDSDLAGLDPKATKTIEIEQFVDLEEIDPIMYDSAYNVVPDPSTPKPYKLLLEAMESSGKVAVARFVMRTKEHVAALRPLDGRLVLSTMVFADEVNDPSEFEALEAVAEVEVSAKERKVAEALIDSLTEPYDPAEYVDQYREKVLDLIESKASGATEIVEGTPAEEDDDDKVVDIMAALEASIADAKKARKRHPSTKDDAAEDAEDEKPAKAKKTTKKATKKASSRKASEHEVAYDEGLAARLRDLVAEAGHEVTERKMFGGLAFMVAGSMAVAVSGQGGMMVRVDPDRVDDILATTPATPMEMRGRPMTGWLRVAADDVITDEALEHWTVTSGERPGPHRPEHPGSRLSSTRPSG